MSQECIKLNETQYFDVLPFYIFTNLILQPFTIYFIEFSLKLMEKFSLGVYIVSVHLSLIFFVHSYWQGSARIRPEWVVGQYQAGGESQALLGDRDRHHRCRYGVPQIQETTTEISKQSRQGLWVTALHHGGACGAEPQIILSTFLYLTTFSTNICSTGSFIIFPWAQAVICNS